jgi:hypothetical protein
MERTLVARGRRVDTVLEYRSTCSDMGNCILPLRNYKLNWLEWKVMVDRLYGYTQFSPSSRGTFGFHSGHGVDTSVCVQCYLDRRNMGSVRT